MAEPEQRFRDATRVVRAGLPDPMDGQPFLPGPTFAAPYHLAGDPRETDYVYGRVGNPTWTGYERALAELEGGPVVVFGSGMAAASAVLFTTLRPGDLLVLPSDGYYTLRNLADGPLTDLGIRVRYAPTAGSSWREAIRDARLVWLETPSNPGLDVCDIARVAQAAGEEGALVAVDNTTATPLGQQPLRLGADFSIASDTKALTGHSDVILGHVAAREETLAARVRGWRTTTGSIPGPMETWLAHRSLPTLELRLGRQGANAREIAEWLSIRSEVRCVRYPGLESDPAYPAASRQMSRYGCLIGFELSSAEVADRFLAGSRLVTRATSFGGTHTTAERRARWGDPVPEGFIRLSVGCENSADLIADLGQAFTNAQGRVQA